MRPVPELDRLRYNPVELADIKLQAGSEAPLPDVHGDSIELCIEMQPPAAGRFGVKVLCSPDGSEHTTITCDPAAGQLIVDTRKSGEGPTCVEAAPFKLAENELLLLNIFIDKSFVEAFANDRQAIVQRVYPTRRDSTGVVLFSQACATEVPLVQAWEMMPSNPW